MKRNIYFASFFLFDLMKIIFLFLTKFRMNNCTFLKLRILNENNNPTYPKTHIMQEKAIAKNGVIINFKQLYVNLVTKITGRFKSRCVIRLLISFGVNPVSFLILFIFSMLRAIELIPIEYVIAFIPTNLGSRIIAIIINKLLII